MSIRWIGKNCFPSAILTQNNLSQIERGVECAQTCTFAPPFRRARRFRASRLIELLQTIATREYIKAGFKLAIVVSAYDLIIQHIRSLAIFFLLVARELPMLDQFLRSNADLFHMATFVVSAQGGVYALPMLLPEMLKHFKEWQKL